MPQHNTRVKLPAVAKDTMYDGTFSVFIPAAFDFVQCFVFVNCQSTSCDLCMSAKHGCNKAFFTFLTVFIFIFSRFLFKKNVVKCKV